MVCTDKNHRSEAVCQLQVIQAEFREAKINLLAFVRVWPMIVCRSAAGANYCRRTYLVRKTECKLVSGI